MADLTPEDCVVIEPGFDIREVGVIGCQARHDAEVFATVAFDGLYELQGSRRIEGLDRINPSGPYPGWSVVRHAAYDACQVPFEAYVGVTFWESIYDIATITPGPSAWADGDREVICLVVDIERRTVTGQIKGTAK